MLKAICIASLASAGAYELPMSRRAMLARVAAAAPAFADGDNKYLTAVKRPEVSQVNVAASDSAAKGVGRQALLDENGAAIRPGAELGTTKNYANFANANK